jgi:hypothetical protein
MRKLAALAGVAAIGLTAQTGFAYEAGGTVTFTWGGNGGGDAHPMATPPPASPLADLGWTSNGSNALSTVANSTYFSDLSGYNSRSYYNPDFVPAGYCESFGGSTRKYGCRFGSVFYGSTLDPANAGDIGPVASATGLITVTDTTLTGTLTVNAGSDEPTGATTTFIGGQRVSNSPGNGFDGFNIRSADGSPFGNYWQGITSSATLTLNLTGTFQMGSWEIDGGTVAFFDPGFACQQGGFGGTDPGTLCLPGTAAGSQNPDGGRHLSWGWDLDGARTGNTALTQLDIRDASGVTSLSSLAGVLASISIDGSGNVTTNNGEYRRGLGSAGGGCADHIRWDGSRISCGTVTIGKLVVSGNVTEIPVPAAAWLIAPALLAVGRYARRRKA